MSSARTTRLRPSPGKTESEEYLNSEKYEIRQRDRNGPGSLVPLITNINHIRRANPALQSNGSLHFHTVDNPSLLCYSKSAGDNTILVAINLDPFNEQSGWIDLDLKQLGIPHDQNFDVEDLLTATPLHLARPQQLCCPAPGSATRAHLPHYTARLR